MTENCSELFRKNHVKDGPIARLDLSPRAGNILRLNGIRMLSQLAVLDEERLEKLPYSTPLIAREIVLCLANYLRDPENLLSESASEPKAMQAETKEQSVPEAEDKNVPIEKLHLSVRSYNALMHAKLHTVQALVGKTAEELLQIRNLGAKSAEEIVEAVKAYLATPHKAEESLRQKQEAEAPDSGENASPESAETTPERLSDDRPIEALNHSIRSYNALKRAKVDTIRKLLDLTPFELKEIRNLGAKSLAELESVRNNYVPPASLTPKAEYTPDELKPLLLNAFQQPFHGLSWQEFRDAMPETATDDAIKHAVGSLLAEHALEYVDFRCYKVYPSFYAYLKSYLNTVTGNDREVMARRYAGETLDAIAQDLGITRERVRQIQETQNKKLLDAYQTGTGFPVFDEDFYEALYTRCNLPDVFWSEELALPESSINYLKTTFRRGTQKPEEILRDEEIPVSLRYRVQSFLNRDKIRIDRILFPKKRSEIEDYAMQKYTQDEITYERFIELYNGMLEDNGVPFDEKIYYTEGVMRTRLNRLSESRHCLWKQGARLRWYDIDARDYTELLEKLSLGSYQNTEVSTRKFMMQYPDTMEDYDIRDPYELHNLLKKISKQYALGDINFSRQPILQFGEFDRREAIKEAMIALSPVTQQDLLEYLYLEYGYDRQTATGYLTSLSAWYHSGVYSVDFKPIPEQRVELLQAALTEDFYYLDELKHLYEKLFSEAEAEEINPYSLKALGFVVYSNYVVRHYPSAGAYFTYLLTKEDVYDISPLQQRYGSIVMFTQTYAELLKAHRLFRFEKNQVISARRLERLNVTEELIEDYCAAVKAFTEEDCYFTICSLRQEGFTHDLEKLGLSDYFYASLLGNDERFTACRVFNELVLYNGIHAKQLSRADFLQTQLRDYESVVPEDFMQDIQDRFGIVIPDRWEVTGAVKDSELYYDSIMDKVYREKSLYYADIED